MARMLPASSGEEVDGDVPRQTRSGSAAVEPSRRSRRQQSQQPENTALELDSSNDNVITAKRSRKDNPNSHPNNHPNGEFQILGGKYKTHLTTTADALGLAAIIEESVHRANNGIEQLQSYAEAASGNPQQIDPQLHDAFSAPEDRGASLQQIAILKSVAPQVFDTLPILAENASIVLRYLEDLVSSLDTPASIIDGDLPSLLVELYEGTSRAALMFRKRINALQQSQGIFLPNTYEVQQRYLQPSAIFQALFNVNHFKDIPMQQLGARDVIYIANLANAVKDLLLLQPADPNVMPMLQEIDNEFPHQFLAVFDDNHGTPGSSTLSDQAFAFGLSLRTQLVARTWMAEHNNEGFDPVDAMNLYFYFADMQKMWQVPNWQSDGYHQMLSNQLDALRAVTSPDGQIDFAELENRFPWIQLQQELCTWAMARFHELTRILESKGGIGVVLAQLRADLSQPRHTQLPVQTVNHAPPGSSKTLKKGGAKALKKAAKRVSGKGMLNLPDATQPGPLLGYPDNTGASGIYPQLHANAQAFGTEQRRQGIFDRQDTAQRLQFDHDDSQPADGAYSNRISDPSAPNSSAFNVTQDTGLPTQEGDAFQQDNRQATIESLAEQARVRAENRNQWLSQRGGEHETLSVTPEAGFQAAATFKRTADMGQDLLQGEEHAAKRVRMDGEDYIPQDMATGEGISQMPYQPPPSNYDHVNILAKQAVALHNKNTKGPQQRKAWTHYETNALADYITKYGISYTLIKTKDREQAGGEGILWQRDQVALKDKARNMKFDYLK